MTFLKALVPLLPSAASFQIHLTHKDGKLNLLLLPQLAPAQDDEDPGVAAFRAVLASAVKIEVPADADPDTYVATALNELAGVRGEAVSELDAYRNALAAAKEAAKAADEARRQETAKKASSKAAKPAKGGSAPVAASANADAQKATQGDDAEGEQDAAGDTAATDATADSDADDSAATGSAPIPPPPPAAAGQTNLFSDLGL